MTTEKLVTCAPKSVSKSLAMNSRNPSSTSSFRSTVALVVAVLAFMWFLGGVAQTIAAYTAGAIEPLPEFDQKVIGVFAYPLVYPRMWPVCWTLFWGATLAAGVGCYKDRSWGCKALQISMWSLTGVVLLAAALQHQTFTFLEQGAQNPAFSVALKIVLWTVALVVAAALAYIARRLSHS